MAADPARFYGAPIPRAALALRIERLTHATDEKLSLVDAHLEANHGYYGSIDKTLAGLFILEAGLDDAIVLDLREPAGAVYVHDYEHHTLTARWKSLAAYAAWRKAPGLDATRARAASREDAEQPDAKHTLPRAIKVRTTRKPDSPQLWARLRWLVGLFAQPESGSDDEAFAFAFDRLVDSDYTTYPAAFAKEKRGLAKDPHNAICWLLTFVGLGLDDERDEVVAAVRHVKHPLLQAFLTTFGAMSSTGELDALPSFRPRRSEIVFAFAEHVWQPAFTQYAKAFEIDPDGRSLPKAFKVWEHAKTNADRARVAAVAQGNNLGALYLRAELAVHAGKPIGVAALLAAEPHHPRILELAIAAGAKGLAQRLATARLADTWLSALGAAFVADEETAPILEKLRKAEPAVREVVARRIIANPDVYDDDSIGAAAAIIDGSKASDRIELLVHALMSTRKRDVLRATARKAKHGDRAALALLDALLAYDESGNHSFIVKEVKEHALDALDLRIAEPARFTRLLGQLGKPGQMRFTSDFLFRRLQSGARIYRRLTPAQQAELAIAIVAHDTHKVSSGDPRTAPMYAVLSPRVHKAVMAWLKKVRRADAADRYADFLALGRYTYATKPEILAAARR